MAGYGSTSNMRLTAKEQAAWRAFVGANVVAPRVLDADLHEIDRLNIADDRILVHFDYFAVATIVAAHALTKHVAWAERVAWVRASVGYLVATVATVARIRDHRARQPDRAGI
jgi:hypothetical protein